MPMRSLIFRPPRGSCVCRRCHDGRCDGRSSMVRVLHTSGLLYRSHAPDATARFPRKPTGREPKLPRHVCCNEASRITAARTASHMRARSQCPNLK